MKQPDEIKKENPFRVPEGYLETLTDRIMSVVEEKSASGDQPEGNKVRKIRLMPFFAMAAAIIGFAVIAAGMVRLLSGNEKNMSKEAQNEIYADVITEDIDIYMIEYEWDVSEEIINMDADLQPETIIDYLLLENITLTDIYEIL